MPVLKKDNGKWGIGSGKGIYDSKEEAERAYKGYLFSKAYEKKHGKPPPEKRWYENALD